MKTLLCIVICSLYLSAYSQDYSSDLLKEEIIILEKKINSLEFSYYLQYCKDAKGTPPIYALRGITEKYNEHTECKAARQRFDEADNKLKDILKQYPEYTFNMSFDAKQMLFRELHNTNPEYRKARITRDSALSCSNLVILETIVNDYANQSALLPISSLPAVDWDIIHQQIPEYNLLAEKLCIMKEVYMKKVKQEIEEKYGIGNTSKP